MIIILDFGSQYTQLIARRIREFNVYCEIYYNLTEDLFDKLAPCGIILSGGPASVSEDDNPILPNWLFTKQLPILGICYGMQIMALQLGGQVRSATICEYGYAQIKLQDGRNNLLFTDIPSIFNVWMSHGDQVITLPDGFKSIAATANTPIAAMADEVRKFYGLQFHPEVTHTQNGVQILRRFVIDICEASPSWTMDKIINELIYDVKERVGTDKVLLAVSGGVDSSVVAALLHNAIGKNLTCVFVDTGLLRLGETEQIQAIFQHLDIPVLVVDATERFFLALQGVSCPETKRKIIGQTFINVFEAKTANFPEIKWLAQGTIYPDVIESAATTTNQHSTVIKSHHNVGGLPKTLSLQLLEPIRKLFKDEVRKLGLQLGLPTFIINRHPFPGPGLGVRILGEIKPEYVAILRQADAIFLDELYAADLYNQVGQAFVVFLPIKSVGVMGDGRRYEYVLCLRAVNTIDFMTAEWSRLPWEFLARVSNRIINEVRGVSRITYDISSKPPATIEWE